MTRRILLSYLSLALFVLIVLEVPLGVAFAGRERERFSAGVASDAAVLATRFEDALDSGAVLDPRAAEDYAARTGARVVVVDSAGESIVDTVSPVGRSFASRPEIATALTGTPTQGTRASETLGTDLFYVATPIASGGTVHGALRVTLPTEDVDARIRRFWLGLAVMGGVILLAVAGLGWTLARSVTRPLRRLEDSAHAFGRGELTPQPTPERAPPEVAALSDTMNEMAVDLQHLLDTQRSFVADASHQLRTPLTALRLRVENLGARVGEDGRDDAEAAALEIERLRELVDQLLALARADRPGDRRPVDLTAVVADRLDTWGAAATEADVTLTGVLPDGPLTIALTPGGVEQALDNLLDNAIGVSPAGAVVEVTLTTTPSDAELTVRDHGPGLSDPDKVRALDRFWRGRTDRPGTGLGLPIARAVAEAHGGTIGLTDAPGGGLEVRLRLPLDPAPHARGPGPGAPPRTPPG